MSVFKKICSGLLLSALSFSAHAASTESQPQTPGQEPAETSVDVTDSKEVIQVLHIGVSAEVKIIDLIKERNPDQTLQQFIQRVEQEVTQFNQRLEELANNQSVSLSPEELTQTAQMIETQMSAQVEALAQKPEGEFRRAVIEALVNKYQKAMELYTQVSQQSRDQDLKSIISEFRPMAEQHLSAARELLSTQR